MDLSRIQNELRESALDGWLLYDFQGSNRISAAVAGIPGPLSRRWFCLVPARGEPTWIVHRIEQGPFGAVQGLRRVYLAARELESHLGEVLAGVSRVAMEYSPRAQLPTAGRVDAGTIELVRACGVEVVSSADLAQRFFAPWGPEGLASHLRAAEVLSRAKDEAFEMVRRGIADGSPVVETEVQNLLVERLEAGGLVHDHPPIVAVGSHGGDPHFAPTPETDVSIEADQVLMIDLWGKEKEEHSIYADMTWMAWTGNEVPPIVMEVWEAVRRARDAAVEFLQRRHAEGATVAGFELDRAARRVIEEAGHGAFFLHRTGHSIGGELHGDGANLDSLETHDERPILVGTGFSVEPGIYRDDFGVRSEIDVYLEPDGPRITTPCQRELLRLNS